MRPTEQSYSVLLVSASDSFNQSLRTLLPESRFPVLCTVTSVSAAKRTILESAFDFVLINSPLPDDIGSRFAIDLCNGKGAVVLLLVKNELYEEVSAKVRGYGVFTLAKPTSRSMLAQALEWLVSARERLRRLEKKTMSVEEKMEEIRLVNRAKWVLIEQLKMTEPDAHRYIEKQAMDLCSSKKEVAETIIRTYS